ncbi:MAG: site-specific integrase [Gordonia sp. (in: high G+C Gram-positive bacteria)]
MATIERYSTRSGRRYRVRYRKPDGRQTDKRGFTTKAAAEAWAATNTVSINTGSWIDPRFASRTVGDLGAQWIQRQTHLKPSAFKPISTAWRLRVEPRWGAVPIGAIKPSEVQSWLSGLKKVPRKPGAEPTEPLAATGVIYAHQVLHAILDDAVRDRMLASNPADGMALPRKRGKLKVYLTNEQVHAFAAAVRDTDVDAQKRYVLVLTLAYTAVRWGEATGLKVRGVNALRRRLLVRDNAVEVDGTIYEGSTKGHRDRTVPVPTFLMDLIVELCAGKGPDDLVFDGPDGKHLPLPPYTRGWWQQSVSAAGIPRVTPHDLRHTAASLAVQAGANVKALQRMLGHSSAALTLDVYADLFDSDLDSVADHLDEAVGRMWAQSAKR